MKSKIFPIFITSLGLFTAYAFYALWHDPPPLNKQTTDTHSDDTHFVSRSKDVDVEEQQVSSKIHKNNTPLNKPTETNNFVQETAQEASMEEAPEHLTLVEMQEKTQEVYASLTPDNYEEVQQEANDAFDAINMHLSNIENEALKLDAIEELTIQRMTNAN